MNFNTFLFVILFIHLLANSIADERDFNRVLATCSNHGAVE